jgi:ribosomal protein S18
MDSLHQLAKPPVLPKVTTDWKQSEEDSSTNTVEPKKTEIKRSYRIYRWEQPNYKYIDLLFRSIAYNGKLLSSYLTKADVTQQRSIARSVKQARVLGLLPFVHKDYDSSRV